MANVLVDLEAVGLLRLGRRGEARGPGLGLVLDRYSPCIAARVGRIVPRAGSPIRPVQELRAWLVRVRVVVEDIRNAELPGRDCPPTHGPPAAELVGFVLDRLRFR